LAAVRVAGAALETVKGLDDPVMVPAVAASWMLAWASYSVIEAVATPLLKVRDDPDEQLLAAG
jgi:hypothetical protein